MFLLLSRGSVLLFIFRFYIVVGGDTFVDVAARVDATIHAKLFFFVAIDWVASDINVVACAGGNADVHVVKCCCCCSCCGYW